jgi:hypothetical protein
VKQKRPCPGVREYDIDLALLLLDRRIQPPYVGQYCHIGLHCDNVATDAANGLIQFFLPSPCDEDERALPRQSAVRSPRPNPLLPPVTTATLPSSFNAIFLLLTGFVLPSLPEMRASASGFAHLSRRVCVYRKTMLPKCCAPRPKNAINGAAFYPGN